MLGGARALVEVQRVQSDQEQSEGEAVDKERGQRLHGLVHSLVEHCMLSYGIKFGVGNL